MTKFSPRIQAIAVAYAWSFGFWMTMAILLSSQQYVIEREFKWRITFLQIVLLTTIRFVTFALLTPPLFYIVGRFPISRTTLLRRVAAYGLGAALFVLAYAGIRGTIAPVWDVSLQRFVPRGIHQLSGLIFGTFGDQISIYLTIVIAAHAYAFFVQVQKEELQRAQLQEALAASELQVLKSQLHPHFLFNTLHGISTSIEDDPALAKAMLVRLSGLLRTALDHASTDLVSLNDELHFITAYLELEGMRLGPRLQIRWSISPETRKFLVPQLILQPIVENALLYGIACRREGGWVEIVSCSADGLLELRIQNSVGGSGRNGAGIGLKNTVARLKGLYCDDAKFSFAIADQVATTKLIFPVIVSLAEAHSASSAAKSLESHKE